MPLYSQRQVAMTPEYLLIPTPAKRQLLRSSLGMKWHTLTSSCWEPHSEERDCISLGFLCSLKNLDALIILLVIFGILRLHNDLFGASAGDAYRFSWER